MANLQYKDFVWPNDPEIYQETATRDPLYTSGTYSGMGYLRRVITGSGAFVGTNAYEDWKELMDLAEQTTPGYLTHPDFGKRYCYLTKLTLEQESHTNFIRYSFAFTEAQADGSVPQ